jgi:hypothetical protein
MVVMEYIPCYNTDNSGNVIIEPNGRMTHPCRVTSNIIKTLVGEI